MRRRRREASNGEAGREGGWDRSAGAALGRGEGDGRRAMNRIRQDDSLWECASPQRRRAAPSLPPPPSRGGDVEDDDDDARCKRAARRGRRSWNEPGEQSLRRSEQRPAPAAPRAAAAARSAAAFLNPCVGEAESGLREGRMGQTERGRLG